MALCAARNCCTRSLFSRKERQLWIMLWAISFIASTSLILFLHTLWTSSMTSEHLPVQSPLNHRIVQPDQKGPTDRMPPRSLPRLVGKVGELSLQGPTDVLTYVPAKGYSGHLSELVEPVGEEQNAKGAEEIARGDKESSRLHGVLNKQRASPSKYSSSTVPWLRSKSKNMTQLEQVIHRVEFLTDDESAFNGSLFFQPLSSFVMSFKPELLISSVHCPSKSPYVLLLIPSVESDVEVRKTIRSTWASPAYGAAWPNDNRDFTSLVQVVFFLGVRTRRRPRALEEESRRFQDIVQMDFYDSYQNLSLKMGLAVEWSAKYCPGAVHVMKVDQDTFVNLSFLLDFLFRLSGRGFRQFVVGFHHSAKRPPVARTGKWAVPEDIYPFVYFPRYLYGHSYVISSEAVKKLVAVWRYLPLIPNEDAFLTGVVAKAAGVSRLHCDCFAVELKADKRHPTVPRKGLADGRSISQTNFKPAWKLNDTWLMVKRAYEEQ